MDYKETLNLPKTQFPMRANLPQNEPAQVKRWAESDIYRKLLESNRGNQPYILHDGPPYANEGIHLGHALNKILKDFIVKYKSMTGFFAPYVPGWDCHGLPIELQVERNIGRARKSSLSKADVRKLCREHAEKFVSIQREEFKRLGVLGDWEHPYKTIDFSYEAAEVRELGKFAAEGSLYRRKKPVYWCASCVTALAEAEVEYDDHTSPSIYVKFPVKDARGKFVMGEGRGSSFVIWTTTPWTLPANQAIAVHPELLYRSVKTSAGDLIMAQDLLESLMPVFGFGPDDYEIAPDAWVGAELEQIVCTHPWLDREVKVILGDFVTKDQGTGCVHIAPGHGQEDYEVGQRYGLEVVAPVDAYGRFTAEAGDLEGEMVFRADPKVLEKLVERDVLLREDKLTHSYPHCWRCKKAVFFRATEQWFISMEENDLRRHSLEAIEKVRWIPPWGRDRIRGMLESRPDWCISRQRSWGVPIPVLYCAQCHEAHLSPELCGHVADIFTQEGSDAWFVRSTAELVPPGFRCSQCGGREFSKEEDILDVWFDSGVSHAAVVETHPQLGGRADLYLEGSDQHRGWFHTSLLTSVATRGRAPYESVLTHGFALDGKGRKMSKSQGNVTAPDQVLKRFGAEVIRLWVAAEDYREDVRISEEILNRLVEAYRRLRNTARFLIGNLYDYDPQKHRLEFERLEELDRWILGRAQRLLTRCRDAYGNFEFHIVYHALNNFCSVDLSALYLDIVKDRLYCEGADSAKRRSAQTALFVLLDTLTHLMAPILSFTADEIWQYSPVDREKKESVLLSTIPEPKEEWCDVALASQWELRFKIRGEVLKALETARNAGAIGHSLDAKVVLYRDSYEPGFQRMLAAPVPKNWWEDIFIVSQVERPEGDPPEELRGKEAGAMAKPWGFTSPVLRGPIAVYKASGGKCERCWKFDIAVGGDVKVCPRCSEVL